MTNILQQKRQLRDQLKIIRKDSDLFHNQHTSFLIENIYRFVCTSCAPKAVVSCFWPLEGEADLRPLMQRLYQDGYQIVLPKTPLRGNPLTFHVWSPTASMQEGRYKTVYPDTEIVKPDLILVPLMAFDRDGNRLGYGGGYYDRTLQYFPNAKVAGVAFSYQEVTSVPTEKFDFSLPAIITELEIIYIKG